MYQHTNQQVRSSWQGEVSELFSTVKGVCQGGVLSPVMFTLYVDVLLQRPETSGIGCIIGQNYYGMLCFADDISLLLPTCTDLQRLIHLWEEFGTQYNIKYSPKKIAHLHFGRHSRDCDLTPVTLYNTPIPWSKKEKTIG